MLITGGAGLIGTAAKTFFEQQGWVIRTFDQKKTDLDGRPIDFVGDILDYEAFREPFQAMDGVLHLAAISRVIDAELNKEECTRVNLKGTKRTLDFASQANCKWFIFGSSREVYGEPSSFPVSEEDGVSPINHYGHANHIFQFRLLTKHHPFRSIINNILTTIKVLFMMLFHNYHLIITTPT